MKKQVLNPYLPSDEYIADAEPHVFDGRLYIFGSHDSYGGTKFCENDYVCWSAPVDDLSDWNYEGVIYHKNQDPKNKKGKMRIFAPDVCKGTDGRYYLYYGLSSFPCISVAVCDEPAGKYEFYGYVRHKNGKLYGTSKGDYFPFDPAVLNDNGKIYLYSGFSPADKLMRFGIDLVSPVKGAKGGQVVELCDDMLTVKKVKSLICGAQNSNGTGFEGHEFYEASSIRKFNNKYYFIYSSVLSHELAYAVSDYPDKDFVYGGVLHSNGDIGINGNIVPLAYWGNNHGSVECINGKYYIFGHRHTFWRECSRQGVAEEIFMDENGFFSSAEITSCGLNGKPLGFGKYEAGIACNLYAKQGAEKSTIYKNKKKTDFHPCIMQINSGENDKSIQIIHNMRDGSVAAFKYFDCDCKELVVTAKGRGLIEIFTDINSSPVCKAEIFSVHKFKSLSFPFKISNKTAIYLKYSGKESADIFSIELK